MNTNRLKLVAFFVLVESPLLLFGWWCPSAEHTFAMMACFMLLWYLFWALVFFVQLTPVEAINYQVRVVQAGILAGEFLITCTLLLLNVSLRTCLYVNAFVYTAFLLSTCGIILYNTDIINTLKGDKK